MTDQNKPEGSVPGEGTTAEPLQEPQAPVAASPRPSKAAVGATDQGPEELPYIDDPVSKWWVIIIVAVFALIFSWAILFGAGGIFDGILGADEPTPSAEPTLIATLEPVTTGAPSLIPDITAEPALPSAQPEPTLEPEPSGAPTSPPTEVPTPPAEPSSTGTPSASEGPAASPGG
jgi:hypothetical protein